MDKVRTASGAEFNCGFFAEASIGTLYMILNGITPMQAVTTFYNREETARLEYIVNGDVALVKEGYVINTDTVTQADGSIRIGLRRPFVGEEV